MENQFIQLGMAYLLGIMVPGPSLSLIIKNGILYSRAASLIASFGIMAGIAIQAGMVLIGLSFIEKDSTFFKTLNIFCSLYLFYLGFKSLNIKNNHKKNYSNEENEKCNKGRKLSWMSESFLLELLNPIASTFFISIFTIIIDSSINTHVRILYWLEIVILGSIWFFGIASIASSKYITMCIRKFGSCLEVAIGCLFIFFATKLLFF